MSYSFNSIQSLPDQQVISILRSVDPNYQSKGRDFDQYSLAYIASLTGQLNLEDLSIIQNPRFNSLYFLPNDQLLQIAGPNFRTLSKFDLVKQIINSPAPQPQPQPQIERRSISQSRVRPQGHTQLQKIFPNNDVCMISGTENEEVWRITNIRPQVINYFRIWLENNLLSLATNWVNVKANTSTVFYDEYLAHRIGLIPIDADPLRMEDFTANDPNQCTDNTCIVFDLQVNNPGPNIRDVVSGDLVWVPLGNQAETWRDRPPRPLYDDMVIMRLYPGQEVDLRAFAVRGTADQHAKWAAALSHYRLVSTRSTRSTAFSPSQGCASCEQLVNINIQPGFNCYYLTIELVGGLTFEDIDRQLETRFDWSVGPSFEQPNYIF